MVIGSVEWQGAVINNCKLLWVKLPTSPTPTMSHKSSYSQNIFTCVVHAFILPAISVNACDITVKSPFKSAFEKTNDTTIKTLPIFGIVIFD